MGVFSRTEVSGDWTRNRILAKSFYMTDTPINPRNLSDDRYPNFEGLTGEWSGVEWSGVQGRMGVR
ncbi:hypothetical protein DOM22_15205 [Bdellovibrio sp. ZAP7]|nr:hypothetical protein DOM22_15205 [Bdellovibrio sp. ZAP7]